MARQTLILPQFIRKFSKDKTLFPVKIVDIFKVEQKYKGISDIIFPNQVFHSLLTQLHTVPSGAFIFPASPILILEKPIPRIFMIL